MDYLQSLEFVTVLFLFYVLLFGHAGMWDLSSHPGTEPTPLAWEGEVLMTGHQRSPSKVLLLEGTNIAFKT